MPYYSVNTKGEEKPRVIEADNPAAAMKHAAESMFTISKPMRQAELVSHMMAGGKVEKAGEKPADAATEAGDGAPGADA